MLWRFHLLAGLSQSSSQSRLELPAASCLLERNQLQQRVSGWLTAAVGSVSRPFEDEIKLK